MDDAELRRALDQRPPAPAGRTRRSRSRSGGTWPRSPPPSGCAGSPSETRIWFDIGQRLDELRAWRRSAPPAAGRTPRGWRIVSARPAASPGRTQAAPASARPCSCRARRPGRAAGRPGCRRPPRRVAGSSAGSMACASMPRTAAVAACRSAFAVSTAAFFTATAIPKRLLVQFDEEISLVHAVVVVHQNPGDLAVHAGRDERHVAVHECVVRRNGVEHRPDPGNAEHQRPR